jgi:hypothetical protein
LGEKILNCDDPLVLQEYAAKVKNADIEKVTDKLIEMDMKDVAKEINWSDLGLSYSHGSYIEEDIYYPADHFYEYRNKLSGILPVIIQESMDDIPSPWLLNQDIMVALKLRKENDSWICLKNGYEEAVRIKRNHKSEEELLEIKANYLKDYLCARNMFLYITSYSERKIITDDISNIVWKEDEEKYYSDYERWESRITPIHEGGHPFGQSAMVIQVERTDVDDDDDMPSLSDPPTDENTKGDTWEKHYDGRKLFYVSGELWYNEIILPGTNSPLVREDEIPSTLNAVSSTFRADSTEVKV